MGMFDTFVGKIKCPICGGDHEFEEQTKDFDCVLDDFKIGDIVDGHKSNFEYRIDGYCGKLRKEFDIYAVIRNGKLVKYTTVEDVANSYDEHSQIVWCKECQHHDTNRCPAYDTPMNRTSLRIMFCSCGETKTN